MHPDEHALRRLTDELFLTTDAKDWSAARALFADGEIDVDMSSLAGGGPVRLTADALIDGFRGGLHAGKTSHHMATNYRVTIAGDRAEVFAHGYAWNRVTSFPTGTKHTRGNDAVRTHAAGDPRA